MSLLLAGLGLAALLGIGAFVAAVQRERTWDATRDRDGDDNTGAAA